MTARTFAGSKFSCVSSRRHRGSAARDARDEARAHCRAAGIAAGRVEGETDHGLAIAHHIGDDRHDRGRHFGKIEARIPDVRLERDRVFTDVDDTHLGFIPGDSCYSAAYKLEGSIPLKPPFAQEPRGAWVVDTSAGRTP